MSRCQALSIGVVGLLSLVTFAVSAHAGPWTWDGGGSDDFVLTGENWNPDAIPFFTTNNTTSNTDSSLIFTGNIKTTPLFGSSDHFNGITFDANAAAFDLIGGLLRIGPTSTGIPRPITNNSPNTQTFDIEVTGSAVNISANTADIIFNSNFHVATSATGSTAASTRRNQVLAGNVYFNSGLAGFGTDKLPGPNLNGTGNVSGTGGFFVALGGTAFITAESESNAATDHYGGLWNGRVEISNGNIRISHDNALGAGDATDGSFRGTAYTVSPPAFPDYPPPLVSGRTTIGSASVTDIGRLELAGDGDGSISVSERLFITGRSASFASAPAHIKNVNGNNILSGPIQTQNITDARATVIEASDDGADSAELLTITGNITQNRDATGGGSNGLVLRGNGAGIISGNILNGANPANMTWEVHKFDGGTWTIDGAGNDYTGTTHVGAGTLALGAAGAIGNSTVVQVDAGATFDVSAQSPHTIGSVAPQTLKGDGAVTGSVIIASGSKLAVDYDGSAMDSLAISGALNITNATVDFNQIGSALTAGAHVFASYGSLSGATFASVLDLPAGFSIDYNYLSGNQIALVGAPAGLPGDYNNNGVVDAGDYVLWRKGGPLQNEVNLPGTVNAQDYIEWKARFGNTLGSGAGSGSGSATAAVPETTSTLMLIMGILTISCRRRPVGRSTRVNCRTCHQTTN
jgi:autotransporter-associated beta strand protein